MQTPKLTTMRFSVKRVFCAMLGKCFAIAALASISMLAHALSSDKTISQFALDKWRTSDGLPEMAVQTLLQTFDGYLWIGTQEGLARFDGSRFAVFNHANTRALRSDLVLALAEDGEHHLWIGTIDGVVEYLPETGEFLAVGRSDGLHVNQVSTMVSDPDGSIWIGGDGGLDHVVPGSGVRNFSFKSDASDGIVSGAVIDASGALWILSRGTLFRIQHDAIENVSAALQLGYPINRLFLSFDRDPWLLKADGGLSRFHNGAVESWWPAGLPEGTLVREMHEDAQHTIWIATQADGLFRSRQNNIKGTLAEHRFLEITAQTLFEDRDGSLWVGTLGDGLLRLRDGVFTAYTKEEGLSSDNAFSVLQDSSGAIWTGTLDGLTRFDLDEVRHFRKKDGLASDLVSSLAQARDGGVWIGTGKASVAHVLAGKIDRRVDVSTPLAPAKVTAVLQDTQDALWIGTDGAGLARRTVESTQYFLRDRGPRVAFINAIMQDHRDAIWVGTNAGIFKFIGGTFDANPIPVALVADLAISVLHEDSRGTMWIGTFGRGLFAWDGEKLTTFSTSAALPEETINSVVTDANEDVWIGTNRGIQRLRRAQLDAFVNDVHAVITPDRFNEADGMKTAETSGGAQPSAIRGIDNRLWFATSEGVVVVDPSQLASNDVPLRAVIESVNTMDSIVSNGSADVHVSSKTPWLEFHFSAPDLQAGATTKFRYRLNGTDTTWSPEGGERIARYSNLSPGPHRFDVQAERDGHEWTIAATSILVNVDPQFYQTTWFRLSLLATVLLLVFIAHHLRVQWVRMQSAVSDERRRIAGEIHDNLAQGFSGIAIQVDAALRRLDRAPELAKPHLTLARQVAVSSLDEARRSVWNLQGSRVLGSFADALRHACEQAVWGHDVKLTVSETGNLWPPKPMTELHLTRIAQETVSNAIHHGKATEVIIAVTYAPLRIRMTITDDGLGFGSNHSASEEHRGFGLSNIRHRVSQMRGRLEIASSPSVGTRIDVLVPRFGFLVRRPAEGSSS
jgi:ligand-binding sensor domain-containing protein/signal transduction histidine kinase